VSSRHLRKICITISLGSEWIWLVIDSIRNRQNFRNMSVLGMGILSLLIGYLCKPLSRSFALLYKWFWGMYVFYGWVFITRADEAWTLNIFKSNFGKARVVFNGLCLVSDQFWIYGTFDGNVILEGLRRTTRTSTKLTHKIRQSFGKNASRSYT
jgi:hypothetical protein